MRLALLMVAGLLLVHMPVAAAETAATGTETETPLSPLPAPQAGAEEPSEDMEPNGEGASPEEDGITPDLSLGEIPLIETMELTYDIATRALDAYILVRTKYENSDLDAYESLQDFVEQNVEGKAFEADIKAAGFGSVNDWNLALTTLGFAYAGVVDDQSAEIAQQIAELEADTELAQDMKDRMITSLKAMIPSENNKKVVEDLLANADYAEKLKQIELVEE